MGCGAGCEAGQAVVEHQVLVVRVQQGHSRLSHCQHCAGGNHLGEGRGSVETQGNLIETNIPDEKLKSELSTDDLIRLKRFNLHPAGFD